MPLPDLARAAVAGGTDMVQVREPDLDAVGLRALASEVVAAVGRERVAVNNAPRIAASLRVHLHLPERTSGVFTGRPDGGSVSCSVHSVDSLAGVPTAAGFVVAGHLYPTATHPDTPPLGIDGFAGIVAASRFPVVAIGGITPSTVGSALEAGAAGVAASSYVNFSFRPQLAARELRDALERAMDQQSVALSVQVNGKPMTIEPGTTLTAFLEGRNLHPRLVVVERNRQIVAKSAYGSTLLEEGDLLEIAHFVGGG